MGTFSCRPAGAWATRFAPVVAFSILSLWAPFSRAQSCVLAPSGLVGLWRGEKSAVDLVTGNQGKLVNNVSFTDGLVGHAFSFDGERSGAVLEDNVAYHLQDFTIEAWVRRENASIVSRGPDGGEIFGYGHAGYSLGIENDGSVFLTKVGVDNVTLLKAITDTFFHHVAVTKAGPKVVFYVDGRPYPMPPYHTSFKFSTPPAIGTRGDHLLNSFIGIIDEVALYNRPLCADEITSIYKAGCAGKCLQASDENSHSSVPSLTIAKLGNNVLLSWPAIFSNFQVESCSDLSGSRWSAIEPNLIVQNGTSLMITLPIASDGRFYRLQAQ